MQYESCKFSLEASSSSSEGLKASVTKQKYYFRRTALPNCQKDLFYARLQPKLWYLSKYESPPWP